MGNRLTQIATRTGDNGTTGLGNNQRVSKNSLRVHAMGEVDELNSNIGVLLCEDMAADVREVLVEVQHQLFNLGGELSIPGFELLKVEAVAALHLVDRVPDMTSDAQSLIEDRASSINPQRIDPFPHPKILPHSPPCPLLPCPLPHCPTASAL